jgi:hypothetical protein
MAPSSNFAKKNKFWGAYLNFLLTLKSDEKAQKTENINRSKTSVRSESLHLVKKVKTVVPYEYIAHCSVL